jgi:transketolase
LIRPADANETAFAWRAAMRRKNGPTMLVLTRQNLPVIDRSKYASAAGVLNGAYVISKEKAEAPEVLLIASGSEVQLILAAQEKLAAEGIAARCLSMPSWELFREQPLSYREEVLPSGVKARLAVEAASPFGWREWVGEAGDIIGVNGYGASAPYNEIYQHHGLTVENIVARAKKNLAGNS